MELTYEEKLQLDNSKEHLKVVLSNVHVASEELNTIIYSINKAKIELSKLEIKKDKAIKDYLNTLDMVSAQDRREASILLRENKVDTREKKIDEIIEKSKIELDNVKNQTSAIKVENNNLIKIYSSLLLELQKTSEVTKKTIQENEEINKEKLRYTQKLENEILRLNSEIEKTQKNLDKFRKDSSIEIEKTTTFINEQKNKIKNPLELLRREQEELDINKKDLAIIKSRLIKQFNKQNLEKVLPLELQK